MVPAMAGQLSAEPSIRHQKERSFFPFFGEEERLRFPKKFFLFSKRGMAVS